MNKNGIRGEGLIVRCKYCNKHFNLSAVAHLTVGRDIPCPHCKKTIGKVN
jgi:hypothetical protein